MVVGGESVRERGLDLGGEGDWRERREEFGERRVDMETFGVEDREIERVG